ncbi:MAG: MarR family transcriptional regulator [Chloroflexi bacterium]|nr:MarR family transcriptional regulator [Chloroflexota bacterium]
MDDRTHTNDEIYSLLSFMRTSDMFDRYMQIKFGEMGYNTTRVGLLTALSNHGGEMTPTALSKLLFRTQHSITSVVHTLQQKGIVETVANPADGRSTLVRLTEKGRTGIARWIPTGAQIARSAFACLSEDELTNLNTILRRMRAHLYGLLEDANPQMSGEQTS